MDVLTSMEATNHRWLLSTSSVAGVTEFCGLLLVSAGTAGLLTGPCNLAEELCPCSLLCSSQQPTPTEDHNHQCSPDRRLSSGTPPPSIDHVLTCKPLPWWVSSHSGNPYSREQAAGATSCLVQRQRQGFILHHSLSSFFPTPPRQSPLYAL